MSTPADDVLERAEAERTAWREYLRPAAELFHDREGDLLDKPTALELLADEFDLGERASNRLLAGLVGDLVDPVVQVGAGDARYVGVIEYCELDGAYGYVDYDDVHGKRRRVVCAQCVRDATYDSDVTHATAGDPSGSFDADADYETLLAGIHEHYEDAHDSIPTQVQTGASLTTGTTIGGNTSFHAGNDGSGSGLDADMVDGWGVGDLYINTGNDRFILEKRSSRPTSPTVGQVVYRTDLD